MDAGTLPSIDPTDREKRPFNRTGSSDMVILTSIL
jgi:hypothetical protein